MLAGDANRCKPDVHIHHCIKDACGCSIPNEECQTLFTDAVSILKMATSGGARAMGLDDCDAIAPGKVDQATRTGYLAAIEI